MGERAVSLSRLPSWEVETSALDDGRAFRPTVSMSGVFAGVFLVSNRPPNLRLQRTRSASLRSPLSRNPLGPASDRLVCATC